MNKITMADSDSYTRLYSICKYIRYIISTFEDNKERDLGLLSLQIKIILDSINVYKQNTLIAGVYDEITIEHPHLIPHIRKLKNEVMLFEEKVNNDCKKIAELRRSNNVEINYIRSVIEFMLVKINKIMNIDHFISFESFYEPPALD